MREASFDLAGAFFFDQNRAGRKDKSFLERGYSVVRKTGIVTKVFLDRDFAHVRTGADGQVYFLHATALNVAKSWKRIRPGMAVMFTPVDVGRGKFRAIAADLVDAPPDQDTREIWKATREMLALIMCQAQDGTLNMNEPVTVQDPSRVGLAFVKDLLLSTHRIATTGRTWLEEVELIDNELRADPSGAVAVDGRENR
jgi:hypothetical protein